MSAMPNLDELLESMLSTAGKESKKFASNSGNAPSTSTACELSYDDYFKEAEYDDSFPGCEPELNGFSDGVDLSALSTIEFTNSNAAREWGAPQQRRMRRVVAAGPNDSSGKCDDDFVDDAPVTLDIVPLMDYDDCFDKFLESVSKTGDMTAEQIQMGPLKTRRYPEPNQTQPVASQQPALDLHVSNNMSKSQMAKVTKTMLYETRKSIMEMDKLEMHMNEALMKASQQAAADFKAIRDAIMNREAQVLAGLRRAKDNAARTIRRHKSSAQSFQKACEQKSDGDPKRFKQLVDSFQHFYAASRDMSLWARQRPYQFLELKDILEAIENAGTFITPGPKNN